MGGAYNGSSRRNEGNERARSVPALPRIASLGLDLNPVEARRLQLWGEAIIADIVRWRHLERRRREGVRA